MKKQLIFFQLNCLSVTVVFAEIRQKKKPARSVMTSRELDHRKRDVEGKKRGLWCFV